MAKQNEKLIWVVIAAAAAAAIYFITNKPTAPAAPAPVAPAGNQLSYIQPVDTHQPVSDIMNSLTNTNLPPLQLSPTDNATLKPLNLDLMVQTPSSGDSNYYE